MLTEEELLLLKEYGDGVGCGGQEQMNHVGEVFIKHHPRKELEIYSGESYTGPLL